MKRTYISVHVPVRPISQDSPIHGPIRRPSGSENTVAPELPTSYPDKLEL